MKVDCMIFVIQKDVFLLLTNTPIFLSIPGALVHLIQTSSFFLYVLDKGKKNIFPGSMTALTVDKITCL